MNRQERRAAKAMALELTPLNRTGPVLDGPATCLQEFARWMREAMNGTHALGMTDGVLLHHQTGELLDAIFLHAGGAAAPRLCRARR
jgi:hypothetical protein